jgi:hypothetical protein
MSAEAGLNLGVQGEKLKSIVQEVGAKLTDGNKRSWRLEMAISAVIFFLGTAILLSSTQAI